VEDIVPIYKEAGPAAAIANEKHATPVFNEKGLPRLTSESDHCSAQDRNYSLDKIRKLFRTEAHKIQPRILATMTLECIAVASIPTFSMQCSMYDWQRQTI